MKLFYYQDPQKPITYFNSKKQVIIPEKYQEKELRAFWVSTVVNIDLPLFNDEKEYRLELEEIIKTALKYNINTIFFQVRPLNDAFYTSKLNPYSRFLMGKEGQKPPFDVLEYLIQLAKPHKIAIHAWCNPYRVSMKINNLTKEEYLNSLSELNFARKYPELVISDENKQLILNPTKEAVKQFIIASMVEIVSNYDVKGIHWDDYFYPYAALSKTDNDLEDFEAREDKSLSLGDFRRKHVTNIVKRTYQALKDKNEKLKFGVSPFGIWQSKENDVRGSNTAQSTSQSYHHQYADTFLWVKKGYLDYIVPQLYWEFGHEVAPFADLTRWWADVVKGTNVDLYIGHGVYRLGRKGEFENPLEINNQLKYANQFETVKGNVFFTYKNFLGIEVLKAGMLNLKRMLNNED